MADLIDRRKEITDTMRNPPVILEGGTSLKPRSTHYMVSTGICQKQRASLQRQTLALTLTSILDIKFESIANHDHDWREGRVGDLENSLLDIVSIESWAPLLLSTTRYVLNMAGCTSALIPILAEGKKEPACVDGTS